MTTTDSEVTEGVIAAMLLAAGFSSRMGSPKPLLPWDGRTLVEYQVAMLHEAGVTDVVVVTGHAAAVVAAALRETGARVAHNPDYAGGRAGSVRVGARALAANTRLVVVLNVDQPRPAAVTAALIEAHLMGEALITVPAYQGRRGHPIVFDGALVAELCEVTDEHEGLRAVRRAHAARTRELPIADQRILLDLNTPDDYQGALTRFGIPWPAAP